MLPPTGWAVSVRVRRFVAAGEQTALAQIEGELAGGVELPQVVAAQLKLNGQGVLRCIGVEDGQGLGHCILQVGQIESLEVVEILLAQYV